MRLREQLDALVGAGVVTGYTIEEDAGYLAAAAPTLTYRMYSDGAASHFNLGAFASAMADFGPSMQLSRVEGVVGERGRLRRTRQLCLTAAFTDGLTLEAAASLVRRRFTSSSAAAPGSWILPDVRITGAAPRGTASAYAHCWPAGAGAAVVLTLSPSPPLVGARTRGVRILESWREFLLAS